MAVIQIVKGHSLGISDDLINFLKTWHSQILCSGSVGISNDLIIFEE